jgi:polyhydroxyalkanoate synthase
MSEKGRADHRRTTGTTMAPKTPTPKAVKTPKAAPSPAPALVEPPTPPVLIAPPPSLPALTPPAKSINGAAAQVSMPMPDFEALSMNLARLVEEGGKALAAYLKPMEEGKINSDQNSTVEDAAKTLGKVAEYWLSDPKRAMQAQAGLATDFIQLWGNTLRRFSGEEAPVVAPIESGDRRFSDPEWRRNPFFDFLRQSYSLTTKWANQLVDHAEDVDPATRERAQFYLRQIAGALSPSNFLATNPELLRTTLKENAENLVRGMHMLTEDIEAGRGRLKIRQSDASKFQLGVNMATTPGKVVFRNDLFELIQYAPTTETVFKRPLLIVPPWINKFYVLDLNPEKSFVRWCVAQGLTVFVMSWVNPDERQAEKSFDAYMSEGILTALDAIEKATGERQVTAIGYCVGGTLLAITLAYMAATNDDRIASATLLTTQVDFTDPGELKHFVDAERIRSIEASMEEHGYLEGSEMASAFNMLRPNDLIWSYFVNNYMKGVEPPPFDLLVWNSDSTRMPKANHSFYLRNCYLENNFALDRLAIKGTPLHLAQIKIPIYDLATREDHIAPARSVFTGAKLFGGDVKYVLSGSGHIAGVVNPATKSKYQYWTGANPAGAFDDWVSAAVEHPGSWWVDWIDWISKQAPEKVTARTPGEGKLTPLCDAPGEYVRVKA